MSFSRSAAPLAALALGATVVLTTGCLTSTPQIHQVAQGLERSMPGTTFEREGGIKLGRLSLKFLRWAGNKSEEGAGGPAAEPGDTKPGEGEATGEATRRTLEEAIEGSGDDATGAATEAGPDDLAEVATEGATEKERAPREHHGTFDALSGLHRVEAGNYRISGLPPDLAGAGALERSLKREGWQTLARVRDDEQQAWVVYRLRGRHLRSLMVVAIEGDELSLVRLEGRLEDTLVAALDIARGELEVVD